jgi:ribonuclease HII
VTPVKKNFSNSFSHLRWLKEKKFSLFLQPIALLQTYFNSELVEAGCDEAGRGCLAGPVFAAAVILPKDFYHPLLNDSKQVLEEHRYELRPYIEANAIAWAVSSVPHTEIDRINILWASVKGMHLAVRKLKVKPELLLIDGNRFKPFKKIRHECVIQGDSIYASIAAASILAKTYRDDHMKRLHKKYPKYNWAQNKGYSTPEHRNAIETHGICTYHRKSFRLFGEDQVELFDNATDQPVGESHTINEASYTK